jgi:hypothetical protein
MGLFPPASRADTRLINSPTAEPLGHAYARWEIGAGPQGGVLSYFHVGVFDRLHFGLSYGMQEVLGSGPIDANPHPGFQGQLLLLDQYPLPTLAVGFDSQGRGRWLKDEERYERKSMGFYGVATYNLSARSWPLLTTFNGGINYSLEGARESADLFLGMEEHLGRSFALLLDYDFGFDDRGDDRDRGYLDFGIQWRFQGGSHLRFLLRDLFENAGDGIGRELNFFYLFRL